MSTLEILIRSVSGVSLLLANGFFVTTEFAMTRVRQFDEADFREHPGLERAWEMTEELEIYLTACQVGITVSSILLGVVFEPAVSALIHPLVAAVGLPAAHTSIIAVVLSVGGIQLFHTVWGEQTPTYLGVEVPKSVARYSATPLYYWTKVMYPFIYFGDHLAKWTLALFGLKIERSWTEEAEEIESSADLRRQMGELLSRGTLPDEHREEIINALEITEMPTRKIMVPREEMTCVSTENSPDENYRIVSDTHFARYPLVGESPDEFLGTIYAPSLLPVVDEIRSGDVSPQEVAVAPMTVSADCPVSDLIDRFQAEHQELALVMEAGEIVGLVTATDAFEEVLGELEDPFD